MSFNKLCRYWRTVKYLKASQILFYGIRRGLKFPRRLSPPRSPSIRRGFALQPPLPAKATYSPKACFVFLRRELDFGEFIDWNCSEMPALWRYNLHYFDYLRQEQMPLEQGLALINDWILRHSYIDGIGWHPYPTSLRLVNWIYFLSSEPGDSVLERQIVDSIAMQAEWLHKNVEYHILANHLFENAKGLLFAGAFLGGSIGNKHIKRGLGILRTELDEQFLDDGGHYERTPMYHAILTQDLLDLSNLFSSNPGIFTQGDLDAVNGRARLALDFLDALDPPDSSTLFFNDSTNAIAPEPPQLTQFARRLMDYPDPGRPRDLVVMPFASSGYYIVREPGNLLVLDCGEIGPDYQPGHAHCDTLSYEYFLNGRKIITNCGNFDYETSDERQFARSTAAHNTVVVDGEEQSEVWGAFRVARRARPVYATLTRIDPAHARFSGAHNGYQRLRPGVIHERTMDYFRGGAFRVEDTIAAESTHSVESYVHFVAGMRIVPTEEGFLIFDEYEELVLKLTPFGADAVEVVASIRFPEFGVKEDAMSIRIRKSGAAPFSFGYEVTP